MPAIVSNARYFLRHSDYPHDKAVYQRRQSVPIASFNFNDVTIAHGLPFTPLVTAVWSTSSTMTPTYNISSGPTTSSGNQYNTGISADATNIYITTTNNTAVAVTLYFSIYGYMPSDVSVDAPFTVSQGDIFALSSDYNYTKLFMSGISTAAAGTTTNVITHALGYVPQVALWHTSAGRTSPVVFNDVSTSVPAFNTLNCTVTSSSLFLAFLDTTSTQSVHYRIYLDE